MKRTEKEIQEAKQSLEDCKKMKEAAIQQADDKKVNRLNYRIKMLEAYIAGDEDEYLKQQKYLFLLSQNEERQSSGYDDPQAGLNARILYM